MDKLQIRLLGGFQVQVGDLLIADAVWTRRKARALVKLLALTPTHRLRRDQILECLWPGLDPATARVNLHSVLRVARQALQSEAGSRAPSAYLVWSDDEVLALCLTAPLSLDVEAFEVAARLAHLQSTPDAYAAALALYTGELLPEDRYEEWTISRRNELRQIYVNLLREAAEQYRLGGATDLVIATLQRLLAEEPAEESAHVALMRHYAETGQRHIALRQYQALTAALRRELDAAPSGSSQRLYRAILDDQISQPVSSDARDVGSLPTAPGAAEKLAPTLARIEAGARLPMTSPTHPRASTQITALAASPMAMPMTNLPRALTSFVGREVEIARIEQRLTEVTLLTLTGSGGVGKTRLALQVAGRFVDQCPDGVWLVDLAPVTEPVGVARAVASVFGLREPPDRTLTDVLITALRTRELLLVIDNCEHVIDATANLVDGLLRHAKRLRVMATSRESLGAPGEVVYRTPSLTLPEASSLKSTPRHSLGLPLAANVTPTLETIRRTEAVRLFIERAVAAQSEFVLTASNAGIAARICQRLDGIPLAIELAAARLRLMSLEQIAARLDDRFRLLTDGARTALPRHQTLRATLDWSYQFLTKPEQTLLRRLSVFASSWTLEAAEAVGAGDDLAPGDVVDLLGKLVDKSLVLVTTMAADPADEPRYRLLETVRQYGLEKLAEALEEAPTRDRAVAYFIDLAEHVESKGIANSSRQSRIEYDNLLSALEWAERTADTDIRLARLIAALCWSWLYIGKSVEALRWARRALAQPANLPPMLQAQLRSRAGHIIVDHGGPDEAEQWQTAALDEARSLGDDGVTAEALTGLAFTVYMRGDYDRAEALASEGLAVGRRANAPLAIIGNLNWLGHIHRARGDNDRAAQCYEGAIQEARWLGSDMRPRFFSFLAHARRGQGRLMEAKALYEESRRGSEAWGDHYGVEIGYAELGDLARELGDYPDAAYQLSASLRLSRDQGNGSGLTRTMWRIGQLAAVAGQPVRATRLIVAVKHIRTAAGWPVATKIYQFDLLEPTLAKLRARLTPEQFDAACATGAGYSLDDAIAESEAIVAAIGVGELDGARLQPAPTPAGTSAAESSGVIP